MSASGGTAGIAFDGSRRPVSLRLPATSANLGSGFDTLALALALYLELEAEPAAKFSILATGRNVDICSRLEGNLLLEVYRDTVRTWTGREAIPLALRMRNDIPLGMGCGSSAASRLAAVALASHFGGLGWSRDQVLAEAARLEGHPDNVAACWLGGFVASAWGEGESSCPRGRSSDLAEAGPVATTALSSSSSASLSETLSATGLGGSPTVDAVSMAPPPEWHALLALPAIPLATTASRAVLPDRYSRRDAVLSLQRVAVLTAAFATGRGDLLRSATSDCMHQPYRSAVCPLLPLLLPLAGHAGILSVTLSGAGPAVLLLLQGAHLLARAASLVREAASGHEQEAIAELIDCPLATQPASCD